MVSLYGWNSWSEPSGAVAIIPRFSSPVVISVGHDNYLITFNK